MKNKHRRSKPEGRIWWEEVLEMKFEYGDLLYKTSCMFWPHEIEHYAAMGEQLWAMKNGLA